MPKLSFHWLSISLARCENKSSARNLVCFQSVLQAQYRGFVLLLAMAVPCSWAAGLKSWGAGALHWCYCNLMGQGNKDRRYMRLWSSEEQKHKPLCFDSPGERWKCLAPNTSSGDALVLVKVFSLNIVPLLWSTYVTSTFGRSVGMLGVDALCSAHC